MTSQFRYRSFVRLSRVAGSISIDRRIMIQFGSILFVAYFVITLITAISTLRAANSLSNADIGATLASGESGLDELDEKLAVFDRRFSLLKFWISPVRYTAPVSVLVPPLDRQRKSAELLIERAEIGSSAAVAAIELGRSSFELRENNLGDSVSLSDAEGLNDLQDALIALRADSTDVLEILEESTVVKSELSQLEPSSILAAVGQQMTDQETRLRQIAEFSVLLSNVLLGDISLVQGMNGTFDDLRGFANGDIPVAEIRDAIAELTLESTLVRNESLLMVEVAPASVLNSDYGDLVRDLRDLNVASSGLISSLDTIIGTLAGSLENLASSEESLFTGGGALTNTLQTLIDNEGEITAAVTAIAENADALLALGKTSSISLGSLGDVLNERIEPLLGLSSTLSGAPRVMGEVIGIDGRKRRYLVLGQTSDELRAAGGFSSSAWLLTFKSGELIDTDYIDIATLEDLDSLDEYPVAFEALQLHMDANRMYMRDIGWDPNFPTVGQLAIELFEIGRDVEVDGVIAVTQWSFVDLVTALGGIEIDSGTVGGPEVLSMIVAGTDDEGTVFLSSLFDSLIASLTGESIKSNSVGLLTTVDSLFAGKNLMIYSEDAETQSFIEEINWGGVLSNSRGDRLAIVDSNVGWNKVDRNIDRSFTYEVDLSDLDRPTAQLVLEYTNRSEIDSNFCDIQSHTGGFYRDLLDDCYWNYLRVYVPAVTDLDSNDSLPLAAGSIAVRVGLNAPGSRTVRQQSDDNGFYISGLLTVDPQNVRKVTFEYDLPGQILNRAGAILEYSLVVHVQAGVRDRTGTVTIVLPDGYDIVDAGGSELVSPNLVEFTIHPERNDMIRLTLVEAS